MASDLSDVRRKYAEGIRDVLKARSGIALSEGLVDALAKVPREHFLGPGPWLIRTPKNSIWQRFGCWLPSSALTTNWSASDPKHLYHHDAIVAIDPNRGLNNGQPSGLASWIHFLDLQEGDRVLHVGCGQAPLRTYIVGSASHWDDPG